MINNLQQGVAALLTIVIVSASVLIMAFTASLLGLGELDMGYTEQKGMEAVAIADGCIEESMRRLRLNSNYSGGTLNFIDGSCTINIVASSNNRLITTLATVGNFNKKVQADIVLIGTNIIVNSWVEVSD